MIRVDPRQPRDANQTVISSGGQMEDPTGVAFDALGRLFVTDQNTVGQPNSPGHVFHIDVATGAQRKVASGALLQQPMHLRFAPTGDLFVSDWQTAAIVRVDPVTGAQTAVSAGGMLVSPRSMAILVESAGKRP